MAASLLPEIDPLEGILWEFGDLEGKVFDSIDQLRQYFPESDIYGPVEENKHLFGDGIAYVSLDKEYGGYKVHGYWCPEEEKVIVGKPSAEEYDNRAGLSGSRVIKYFCGHCPAQKQTLQYRKPVLDSRTVIGILIKGRS